MVERARYASTIRSASSFARLAGKGLVRGEFRHLAQLWALGNDTLVVADYRPWRLQYFSLEGQYLGAATPQPMNVNQPSLVTLLTDGTLVQGYRCCLVHDLSFHDQHVTLTRHDRHGAFLDTVGAFPYGALGMIEPWGPRYNSWTAPLFDSHTTLTAFGTSTVIGRPDHGELVVYDESFEPRFVLRFRVSAASRSRDVRQADLDAYRRKRESEARPDIQWMIDEDLSPSRPVRRRFPAFTHVFASPHGSLWAQLYHRPADADGNRYLAFGTDHRFRCALQLSSGRTILLVGDDYVLFHDIDEDGVESLSRYKLLGPNS